LNIRDETVLRELNLYPLWVRRDASRAEIFPENNPVEMPVSVSAETVLSVNILSPVIAASEALRPPVHVVAVAPELVPSAAELKTPQADMGSLSWDGLKQQVSGCSLCKLRSGCTQTVFGAGDEKAEWLFVGEAPGEDEDVQGQPFVGPAGKLLDNMLAAIKLQRGKNVYIANVLKCRPPEGHTPGVGEVASCLPYLQQQIALIKPKLIVALGKTAATSLLAGTTVKRADGSSVSGVVGHDTTLGSLRGTLHDYHGIPLIVTYHPAYLLRSPQEKARAWQDLCLAVQRAGK